MKDSMKEKRAHLEQLQLPLLHLNGSGYKNLSESLEEAHMAILEAVRTLRGTAPHKRDYYPLEAGAFAKAREEYTARGVRLIEVMDELVEMQCRLYAAKNS